MVKGEIQAIGTGLRGPFPLTYESIGHEVDMHSSGTFVTGATLRGRFEVARVGRSDSDVRRELQQFVGRYLEYQFECFPSGRLAYERECEIFHVFSPPDNRGQHPRVVTSSLWVCPRCGSIT
jgi:hypothetical protein